MSIGVVAGVVGTRSLSAQQPSMKRTPILKTHLEGLSGKEGTVFLAEYETIPGVGRGVMGTVLTPDAKAVVVTGGGENKTSVIDTATDGVVANVLTGREPHGAALTEDGKVLLIADRQSDAVSLVDTGTWKVMATVPNVERPHIIEAFGGPGFITTRGQAVTGDSHALSGKNPALVVIDLQERQVQATVPLGGDPHGVAVRP